jgi:ELWxxDGT repeat protein
MLRICTSILLWPFLAYAQVELVETIPSSDVMRLHERTYYGPAPRPEFFAVHLGDKVLFQASAHRGFSVPIEETWVIDESGNRQVLPYLGELWKLDENTLISTRQNQVFAVDQQDLSTTPLFPGQALLFGQPHNGRALAVATQNGQSSLWAINGPEGDTELLAAPVDLSPGSNAIQFHDGYWVFLTNDLRLYRTDGTAGGTRLLWQLEQPAELLGLTPQRAVLLFQERFWSIAYESGELQAFLDFSDLNVFKRGSTQIKANLNGRIIFHLEVTGIGHSLWSTDGSAAGTELLEQINNPTITGDGIYVLNSKGYFPVRNRADTGVLETDGTAVGTRRIAGERTGIEMITNHLYWGEEHLWLVAFGLHQYSGLWMLNNGQLKDCTPWPGYGAGLQFVRRRPQILHAGRQHLYYLAFDHGAGRELFRTDRDGHTELVADLSPGMAWSDIVPIGQAGPWFYFVLNHASSGASLYRVRDDSALPPPPPPGPALYEWMQVLHGIQGAYQTNNTLRPQALAQGREGSIYAAGIYNSIYGMSASNSRSAPSRPAIEDIPNYQTTSGHGSYFLTRLNGQTGQPEWMLTLGNSLSQLLDAGLAAAPGSGVYMSAQVAAGTKLHFSGQSTTVPQTSTVLTRIDSSGQSLWLLTGNSQARPLWHDTDKAGDLVVAFTLTKDSLVIGGRPFSNEAGLAGSENRWGLAKIHADGTVAWAKQLAAAVQRQGTFSLQSMATAPDNHIFLLFAATDSLAPGVVNCGSTTSTKVELWRISPTGKVLWKRALNASGGAVVPTGIAVNEHGMPYICGFFHGSIQFGRLAPLGRCRSWQSFVLALNAEGFPLSSLTMREWEDIFVYHIALNEKGHYALAGVRGKDLIRIPRLWPSNPVPSLDLLHRQFFVKYYSAHHQLMDEKQWFQPWTSAGPIPLSQNLTRMVPGADDDFFFMHPYFGILDTFAHSPYLHLSTGAYVMRLHLQESPLPPPVDDAPLRMSDIEVFPNPATHWLTLRSAHADFKNARLQLFNNLGQQVRLDDIPAYGPYRYMDLSTLPTGLYYLGILLDGEWEVRKVVVYR